ncbi:MAG: hypothetical protein ABI857_09845 [Acidobacteriota bacterium]
MSKDNQKSGAQSAMGSCSDREFEGQGQNPGSGKSSQSDEKVNPSQSHKDEGETSTAGGREGQFSETERGQDEQWSPGSSQSSDG